MSKVFIAGKVDIETVAIKVPVQRNFLVNTIEFSNR